MMMMLLLLLLLLMMMMMMMIRFLATRVGTVFGPLEWEPFLGHSSGNRFWATRMGTSSN
jgi:hypothetical protein